MMATLALSSPAAAEVDVEQRISLSASFAPWAVLSFGGNDGHGMDAKSDLTSYGGEATYGLRLGRHFEIGVALNAQHFDFHPSNPSYPVAGNYANELRVPLHAAFLLPMGDRFELTAGLRVGYTSLGLPEQGAGRSTLRASGLAFGPIVALSYGFSRHFDAFVSFEAVFRRAGVSNGEGYMENSSILGLSLPVALGARLKF